MAYGSPDPYYQPEKFGLVILYVADLAKYAYTFDMFVVWRHAETGQVYYAQDSGCSCPSPFEDFQSLDELTPVENFATLVEDLRAAGGSDIDIADLTDALFNLEG